MRNLNKKRVLVALMVQNQGLTFVLLKDKFSVAVTHAQMLEVEVIECDKACDW